MKWGNFLHFYQPVNQQPDILEKIVVQSYRPIIDGIKQNKNVKISININGALLELFDKHGYQDILENLRSLVKEGRVEITGSAKYHALLPLLDDEEIKRQITLNTRTLKKFLGEDYNPRGFFPPEMAYDDRLPKILEELGFEWIILDEIAHSGKMGKLDNNKLYKIKNSNLFVYFRERRPSNLIMSAMVRSYETLSLAMQEDFNSGRYMITGMDGETFGHHRPGLEKMLFEIFNSKDFELLKISEIKNLYKEVLEIAPVASTWASSEEDINRGVQFLSWNDPENQIHKWQWALVQTALKVTNSIPKKNPMFETVRSLMDIALASDQFWWASAKPWWSVEEIERGAYLCLDLIRKSPKVPKKTLDEVRVLYENIVSTAFDWKRSGKIYKMNEERRDAVRIPFKERTLEKGGVEQGIYEGFMAMIEGEEKKAIERREYEQAIMWRDAIYKIENKSEIYDLVNAIELLRTKIPNIEIEKTLDKYTEKYYKIRGGQPEQRD